MKAQFDTTMREIVEAAGELGSTGVIMVPAFNGQQPCKPHTQETRDYLCEELHKLGEFAKSCGTTVILEPLNRKECFYMRLVADAAAIARDAQSEGVKCMGDFWHMQEETSDYGAFMSAGSKYLQHVHIASRGNRKMPGENGEVDNYVDGFRALKEIGYDKYVSFECGCRRRQGCHPHRRRQPAPHPVGPGFFLIFLLLRPEPFPNRENLKTPNRPCTAYMANLCSSDVSLKQLKERQSASCFIYGVLVLFKFSRITRLGHQAGRFGSGGYPAALGSRRERSGDDGVDGSLARSAGLKGRS